jgi:uncharacterized membrane protein
MDATDNAVRSNAGRWAAIDATRGVAMVLVCLSHFFITYFAAGEEPLSIRLATVATRVATPTFILISGAMLGWIHASGRYEAAEIWRRFIDRGLFLVLVARPLIFIAHLPLAGGILATAHWEFVTDTIAVCLFIAPGITFNFSRHARISFAVVLFATSWSAALLCPIQGPAAAVTEVLFGARPHPHAMAYTFPVLQWLSVYLVGVNVGERLWEERAVSTGCAVRFAARTGLMMMTAAVLAYPAHHVLRAARPGMPSAIVFELTSLGTKLPPGPVYVLFYGGSGLVLLAAIAELERRRLLEAPRRFISLVGRNSLFAFVAQYFVYYTAMVVIRPMPSAAWPLWFLASVGMVLLMTALWNRADGNRWLTVGLARQGSLSLA